MADRLSQEAIEALESGPAKTRVSQEAVEALESGRAQSRVSQVAVEVLYGAPPGKNHVSQIGVEALVTASPPATFGNRLSQVAVEELERNPSPVSSLTGVIDSQAALEVLRAQTDPTIELSQVTLEVLRPFGKDMYVWWRF